MRWTIRQELDDSPIDSEEFESPSHEKGMWPKSLIDNMVEDPNSGVFPASKAEMVKDRNFKRKVNKKKKPTKRLCTVKVATEDEDEKKGEKGAT